ncbi:MAG: GNAT family N-acetyltransferase [Roseibium sp.]|uniref:GNAT family N-acetyltransferase n=1 Tax=Roseibium sp. TaxID=1936156 RepID=UPI002606A260|nr:GNAT family N-acetyltransferase [Roseibium sp.]MCV0427647.1 GNAT family N-acetyltransferase [Roseibium sp.]
MSGDQANRFFPARVTALENVPQACGLLETWYLDEWPAWYGREGPGDARQDLTACLEFDGRLPRCLVALDEASTPVGTVSLRKISPGSDQYPGAWLTALLVPPEFRRSGVGTRLIAAAEQEAGRLGFSEIFSTTASAQSLLLRRDWVSLDVLKAPSGALEIFRKPLEPSHA